MEEEACLSTFCAITGATNQERVTEFCAVYEFNLEASIEAYFANESIHQEFMKEREVVHPVYEIPPATAPPPQHQAAAVGQPVLFQVRVFEGRRFNSYDSARIGTLRLWWLIQFTLVTENRTQSYATRPVKQQHSPEWNESLQFILPSTDDFGIVNIEMRDLQHRVLAYGGLMLSTDIQNDTQWVQLNSDEGPTGQIRVEISCVGNALLDAAPRALKKLRRCDSLDDLADSGVIVPVTDDLRAQMWHQGSPPPPQFVPLRQVRQAGGFRHVANSFNAGMMHWELQGCVAIQPLSMLCVYCRQTVPFDTLVSLSTCSHRFCRHCLRNAMTGCLENRQDLACATCGVHLAREDLAPLLSRDQLTLYDEMSMEKMLEQDDTFTRCPNPECNTPMEKMLTLSGDLNAPAEAKNAAGEPLRGEELHHYNRYRYRCYSCQTVFCSECQATPYHAGYTCERFSSFTEAAHCRYCNAVVKGKSDVCKERECRDKYKNGCLKTLDCGHRCYGVRREADCLVCLHEECEAKVPDVPQSGSEFCNICWVEDLRSAPTVRSKCGHLFHYQCLVNQIEAGWPGDRITFGFLNCPLCKQLLSHSSLNAIMAKHLALYEQIRLNAIKRLKVEGMLKDEKLIDPSSHYFNNPEMYALHSFAYYHCFKCKKPYFGGKRDCEQNLVERRDPEEMICFDCGDTPPVDNCSNPEEHKEWHVWKCRFCCSTSVWFCWGTTRFCDPCHKIAHKKTTQKKFKKCPGKEKCPLKIDHPPHGEEFSLGCGLCGDEYQQKAHMKAIDDDEEPEEDSSSSLEVIVSAAKRLFNK